MSRRKARKQERVRTVVVYRGGKLGYYSTDRVEGAASPIYSTEALLAAARAARAALIADGQKGKWGTPS